MMTPTQITAQIIHLSGMKKALSQLIEVIDQQIDKIDFRLDELQGNSDDE